MFSWDGLLFYAQEKVIYHEEAMCKKQKVH